MYTGGVVLEIDCHATWVTRGPRIQAQFMFVQCMPNSIVIPLFKRPGRLRVHSHVARALILLERLSLPLISCQTS